MTTDQILLIAAIVCFVVASYPHKLNLRLEWLGAGLVVASWL